MKTVAALLTLFLALMVQTSSTAQAQGAYDMSRFTCRQLLEGTKDSIDGAIWLSGYYNGLRRTTRLDPVQFRRNAEVIVAQCRYNPRATVMQTIKMIASRR